MSFMTPLRWLALAVPWVLCLVWGLPARASKPRCRLEQVAYDRKESRLLALASVVELEGTVDADRPAPTYTLLLNGKPVDRAARAMPVTRAGADTYMVLAV